MGVRRSAWFGSAVADERGLHIPGRPGRHAAAFSLCPDGAWVTAGGAAARLGWDDFGHEDDRRPGPGGGCWWIRWFVQQRARPFGLALCLSGTSEATTIEVRREVATWRNRFHRLMDWEPCVPLLASVWLPAFGERGTLAALCWVLSRRPQLRPRLADIDRGGSLLAAIAARPLPAEAQASGLRRVTRETLWALRSLGYRPTVEGRPLPGEPRPPLDQLVDEVFGWFHRNADVRDGQFDRADVARVVRRYHLDIEPWPFGALLTDDPGDPAPATRVGLSRGRGSGRGRWR